MKRLRIHRWNDTENNRLKSSEELSEECLRASEELSEELLEVSGSCLRVSENGIQTVTDMFSSGILTPPRVLLSIVPAVVVASAGYMTMRSEDVRMQLFLYFVGFALMILFDTFRAVGRVLAPQSRVLIAVDLFGYAAGCIHPSIKYFLILTVWSAVTILIIKFTNKACIFAHNWVTAKSVQSAVAKNPESKGYSFWLRSGKNQARIVLSECGLHFGDKILDAYGAPLFLCGYYSAIKKNTKLKNKAEKCQDMIEDVMYNSADLEEENRGLKEQLDELQSEVDQLRLDKQRSRRELLEKDELLLKYEKDLHQLPEEPQQDAFGCPDTLDERIKGMLRNGGSIREVAKFCGVTKNKVEQIRKEIKEELTA